MTKSQTQEYINKEEATLRRPVEIYHIWEESDSVIQNHYRYTSGDADITFSGNAYSRAAIERDAVGYDSKLEISTLNVRAIPLALPVVEFLARNPLGIFWIEVMKLFRDQDPYEANILFLGQIKNISFQGLEASIECTGFEQYLNRRVPIYRYQTSCNHQLYSTKCGIDKTLWSVNATLTDLRDDGKQLTSLAFSTEDDDYFKYGYIEFGSYARMVTSHEGSVIKIRYNIPGLANGDTVTAYAGCDLTIDTCYSKFNNVNNFFGFPYIPVDKPEDKW